MVTGGEMGCGLMEMWANKLIEFESSCVIDSIRNYASMR